MSRRPFGHLLASVLLAPFVVLAGAWSFGLLRPSGDSEAELIEAGREQFTRVRHFDVPPDSPRSFHRLFNARSCAECHRQAGIGGAGPNENNVQLVDLATMWNEPYVASIFGKPFGVTVLHRQSTAPQYAAWREAFLKKTDFRNGDLVWVNLTNPMATPRNLPRIVGSIQGGSTFPILFSGIPASPIEERNTPPLFGLGLLESIPQSVIDAVALAQPPAVRGRSPRLKEGGFGRFGWKSGRETLLAFNENACTVELGLTTPAFVPAVFRPADPGPDPREATEGMISPLATAAWIRHWPFDEIIDSEEDIATLTTPAFPPRPAPVMRAASAPSAPDMTAADIRAMTRFVTGLPAPRQVVEAAHRDRVTAGERHFRAIGCATCHTPNLGEVAGVYSDLLLHKVGTNGSVYYASPSEGTPDFDIVGPDEFRTPPLWGVADSGPYLHDGSAATLEAAILRHNVQALESLGNYQNRLNSEDRQSLIAFLESLRAPQ
jgi:mono/diheme cytochrome c family protein